LIILLIKNLIIQSGTTGFTNDVLANANLLTISDPAYQSIKVSKKEEEFDENDFIPATSFTYTKQLKKDLQDKTFYQFKTKIESAGSLLSSNCKYHKSVI
jgi:hypothetical protein